MSIIEIKNLSFKYNNSEENALNDISLSINKGDFIGIAGTSGSGKTTLTRAINGLVPHHYEGDFYGEVIVAGKDTIDTTPENIALSMGSVFQDIDGQMTATIVEDEILFGLENFGIAHSEIESRIEESLSVLGISHLRKRDISQLSGGQKQKVAICAMLALKPDILVLDEPTGELDPKSSRQIFTLLKELNEKQGITIVIVEQKIMLLSEFSKKLLILQKGKTAFYDDTKNVLLHSDKLEEMGINCPRIITLARKLEDEGLYKGEYPVTISQAKKMVQEVLV